MNVAHIAEPYVVRRYSAAVELLEQHQHHMKALSQNDALKSIVIKSH